MVMYHKLQYQVELISVLKQRLDEMTKRWERSEAELEQQVCNGKRCCFTVDL